MGKKKRGFKKPKGGVDTLRNATSSGDEDEIDAQLESILDDEIDQYNSFKEKSLLEKGKKAKGRKVQRKADESDEEEEVYGLNLTSDEEDGDGEQLLKDTSDEEGGSGDEGGEGEEDEEDDDEDDDDDEDIYGEANVDDGIPNSRAWGKKARVYHSTDYVDEDFGGFQGDDAEMAELEEAEAREIQKRLTAEFDESDFLGLVPTVATKPKKAEKEKEILKMDLDSLSATEKRKLVQRECPEVIHFLEQRKEKLAEADDLKKLIETQSNTFLRDFYVTKYHTIMNYCINISYFLYLRATNPASSKGHPVIKRILQFRRLLDELNTFSPKKYLRSLEQSKEESKKARKSKKVKFAGKAGSFKNMAAEHAFQDQMGADLQDDQSAEEGPSEETLEKRGINYTIAKNKGLTPYRKKELRNPRVKHRMKFRKATVRRKGQVRKPRTETRKYEGELTGIKMNVTKSIKFK